VRSESEEAERFGKTGGREDESQGTYGARGREAMEQGKDLRAIKLCPK